MYTYLRPFSPSLSVRAQKGQANHGCDASRASLQAPITPSVEISNPPTRLSCRLPASPNILSPLSLQLPSPQLHFLYLLSRSCSRVQDLNQRPPYQPAGTGIGTSTLCASNVTCLFEYFSPKTSTLHLFAGCKCMS